MQINVYDQPMPQAKGAVYGALSPREYAKFSDFAHRLAPWLSFGSMSKYVEVIKVSPIDGGSQKPARGVHGYGINITVVMKITMDGGERREIFPSCRTDRRNNPDVYIPYEGLATDAQVQKAAWSILNIAQAIARREMGGWWGFHNAAEAAEHLLPS